MLVWQALVNLPNIGVAGPSNCPKYLYGRLWQIVVSTLNIGMVAAIPCHQVPPPLLQRPLHSEMKSNFHLASIRVGKDGGVLRVGK